MSMNMLNRTAPLSLLYCGVKHGGGLCAAPVVRASGQTFTQKREEELDGYTEENEKRTVKAGISELEVPLEKRLHIQGGGCEDLETETRNLLGHFYRSYCGFPVQRCRGYSHSALPSLQKVVQKVLNKHKITYRGMVQRLFEQANGLDSVRSVLNGVFSDGVISWGRIASVLALGAVVCERLKQERVKEQAEECVDIVVSHISSYICTELHHWFINNNDWDGFVEFFRVEDPESTVRNALMAVAGFGIGACLFTLMR